MMVVSLRPDDAITISIHQIDKQDTDKLSKLIPGLEWKSYGEKHPVISADIKIGNIKIEFYQKGEQS